jgi:hypothetical protein
MARRRRRKKTLRFTHAVKIELIVSHASRRKAGSYEACVAVGKPVFCARGKTSKKAIKNVLLAAGHRLGRKGRR